MLKQDPGRSELQFAGPEAVCEMCQLRGSASMLTWPGFPSQSPDGTQLRDTEHLRIRRG